MSRLARPSSNRWALRAASSLPPDHRRWLTRYALAGTAGTNLAINAALAWGSSLGQTRVPLWTVPVVGGASVITSTLVMLGVLPLTTSVICTGCIRGYQRRGLRILRPEELPVPVRHLAIGPLRRGLGSSGAALAVFGPVIVLVGSLGAGQGLSRASFVISQGIVGVGLGALITPVMAMAAMSEPRAHAR